MKPEQFKQDILPLRKQLLFYAGRFLDNPEDAEDVIQEVYLKLWLIRFDLDRYDSIPAVCMQITKHLCLNRIKVLQRKQDGLNWVEITDKSHSPHLQLEQKDDMEKVMKIIDSLPEMQQMILRMKHVDGFEISEIVEITGSNAEAIRMNLSRARKKVKELFFKMQSL